MTRTHRLAVAAALALSSGAVVACSASVSVGSNKVPAGKLENGIVAQLEKQTELKNPTVTCPENEKDEKGTTFVCTFDSDNGVTGDVDVRITDNDSHASFKTDPASFKIKGSVVAAAVESDFKQQYPDQADSLAGVDCGDSITDTPGGSGTCTITSTDGKSADLTIKIDQNGHASWDFAQIAGG